jgi:hypothetical protein
MGKMLNALTERLKEFPENFSKMLTCNRKKHKIECAQVVIGGLGKFGITDMATTLELMPQARGKSRGEVYKVLRLET